MRKKEALPRRMNFKTGEGLWRVAPANVLSVPMASRVL